LGKDAVRRIRRQGGNANLKEKNGGVAQHLFAFNRIRVRGRMGTWQ